MRSEGGTNCNVPEVEVDETWIEYLGSGGVIKVIEESRGIDRRQGKRISLDLEVESIYSIT